MERYFGNAYRGDPGIPHSGPEPFENVWIGTAIFTVCTWNNPYLFQLTPEYNFHDLAMLHEQYHLKKAEAKNQPYQFAFNKLNKVVRDSYYRNWAMFFP